MSHYLIFNYNNLVYGVPADKVQEVFFLPQLTPIPEAPNDILGAVNVRGNIIPIMDLNLRFGYEQTEYNVNDNVVIINHQELRLGIITNQVKEVTVIDEYAITPELSHDHPLDELKQEKFISGIVQKEDQLILLLDIEALLRYTDSQDFDLDFDLFELESTEENNQDSDVDSTEVTVNKKPIFFPQATEYERKLLEKRANNLRETVKLKDFTGLKPISIFTLNQEFFGVELSLVQEFIKFKQVTPIPCTPNFILGNINLRGEVITIIDIRGLFNLPISMFKAENQAVIVNVEGVVVGLMIDAVNDIFMLNPEDLTLTESKENQINQAYLQGVIPYQEKMLGVINLPEIILGGNLLVDEAV